MNHRVITPRNHPFPFLLYVEWGLLLLAILLELFAPFRSNNPFPAILVIIVFGLMGLAIPTQKASHKWLYTAGQMGLIVLMAFGVSGRGFPFPQLIMVIRSSLIFRLRGRLVVTILAFGIFVSVVLDRISQAGSRIVNPTFDSPAAVSIWQLSQRMLMAFGLNFSLLFGLCLILVLLLTNALVTERESREKLIDANDQLRNYALRVESLAMEQERNRIAREIHDSLGHSLTALNLQIEGALKLATVRPEQSQSFLQEAKRLGSTALQDVRQSVAAMRTNPLKDKPLEEAIATLTQNFHRTTQINPTVHIQLGTNPPLNVSTALYRVIQEALTNIFKHAEATTVDIHLESNPSGLSLIVKDNGKGFDRMASQRSGFGLQGMEERILALQGSLKINSEPGKGCKIQVYLEPS
ncbi:MAG: sensor histidine kinase [Cyanobacteria bacterium P01_F01_bin.150]